MRKLIDNFLECFIFIGKCLFENRHISLNSPLELFVHLLVLKQELIHIVDVLLIEWPIDIVQAVFILQMIEKLIRQYLSLILGLD